MHKIFPGISANKLGLKNLKTTASVQANWMVLAVK